MNEFTYDELDIMEMADMVEESYFEGLGFNTDDDDLQDLINFD